MRTWILPIFRPPGFNHLMMTDWYINQTLSASQYYRYQPEREWGFGQVAAMVSLITIPLELVKSYKSRLVVDCIWKMR